MKNKLILIVLNIFGIIGFLNADISFNAHFDLHNTNKISSYSVDIAVPCPTFKACIVEPICSTLNNDEIAENCINIFFRALNGYTITRAEASFLEFVSYNNLLTKNIDTYFKNQFNSGERLLFGFQYIKKNDSYLNDKDFYLNYSAGKSINNLYYINDLSSLSNLYGHNIIQLIFSRGPIINGYGNIFDTYFIEKIINTLSGQIQDIINKAKEDYINSTICRCSIRGCCDVVIAPNKNIINNLINTLTKLNQEIKLKKDMLLEFMELLNRYEKNSFVYYDNKQIIKNTNSFFNELSIELRWFTDNLRKDINRDCNYSFDIYYKSIKFSLKF